MRLFFHLHDASGVTTDHEGRDLDLAQAAALALLEARAIISVDALEGRIALDQWIDVLDGDGALRHRLRFADAVILTLPPPGDAVAASARP